MIKIEDLKPGVQFITKDREDSSGGYVMTILKISPDKDSPKNLEDRHVTYSYPCTCRKGMKNKTGTARAWWVQSHCLLVREEV